MEPAQIEVGSGYSFSVDYDENDKPIIDLRTYGTVNIAKIKKEIQRAFPDAQIRQKTQSIMVAAKRKRKRKTHKK